MVAVKFVSTFNTMANTSTSTDPVDNSMFLELKSGRKNGVIKWQRPICSLKWIFVAGLTGPHPTPSPAFDRARDASATVLGPKRWSSLTFQPWLRPCSTVRITWKKFANFIPCMPKSLNWES